MAFASGVATRYAVDIESVTAAYMKYMAASQGSALTTAQLQDVFDATVLSGRVLGKSNEDLKGTLEGLTTIASRDQVQFRELKSTLLEFGVPARLLAEALHTDVRGLEDMSNRGDLLSKNVLPALAGILRSTFGPETQAALDGSDAAVGRLSNSLKEMGRLMGESVAPKLANLSGFIADFFDTAAKRAEAFNAAIKVKSLEQFTKEGHDKGEGAFDIHEDVIRFGFELQEKTRASTEATAKVQAKADADRKAAADALLTPEQRLNDVGKQYLVGLRDRIAAGKEYTEVQKLDAKFASKELTDQGEKANALLYTTAKLADQAEAGKKAREKQKELDAQALEHAKALVEQGKRYVDTLHVRAETMGAASQTERTDLEIKLKLVGTLSEADEKSARADAAKIDAYQLQIKAEDELYRAKMDHIKALTEKTAFIPNPNGTQTAVQYHDYDAERKLAQDEAEKKLSDIAKDYANQTSLTEEMEQQRADRILAVRLALSDQLNYINASERAHQLEVEQTTNDMILAAKSQFTGAVLAALQAAGEKNKAIAKAAFIAERAVAVASIVVSTEKAAIAALATTPPYPNFALAGVVRGFGYASAALTAATAIGQIGSVGSGGGSGGGSSSSTGSTAIAPVAPSAPTGPTTVPDKPVMTQESTSRLELQNGARIVALPGTEATIRGYSAAKMIIVDEAARVEDGLIHSVRPMLATTRGRLVALSTPFGRRGWFYEAWVSGKDWRRTQIKASDCPRIDAEWLENERRDIGEWQFRQEYECEFLDSAEQFFSSAVIEAAISHEERPLWT